MGATLLLSVFEVILLFFGAIILGITIHFTIASRRTLRTSMNENNEVNKTRDEWKLRYFNDVELKDKELFSLKEQVSDLKGQLSEIKEQLSEARENSEIYTIEAEEMRKENKKLLAEMNNAEHKLAPLDTRPDYLEQLRLAQTSLHDHNEKINQLLENIDMFKANEERHREMLKNNEELSMQISDLSAKLAEKEAEMGNFRQKEHLTKEMTSMLDNAYSEFNVLQGKMQKLELQVSSSKMINMEYEDLKETHQKLYRDYEEQKLKYNGLVSDNQHLQAQLLDTEDKLHEADFQKHQLQKRVAYLEELNNDLQAVSDANKKLEGQLKRIGELESMLHETEVERDQMNRKGEK